MRISSQVRGVDTSGRHGRLPTTCVSLFQTVRLRRSCAGSYPAWIRRQSSALLQPIVPAPTPAATKQRLFRSAHTVEPFALRQDASRTLSSACILAETHVAGNV